MTPVSASAGWVVLDIEGTTSATGAVRNGLYAYARPRLRGWIQSHGDDPDVAAAVAEVRAQSGGSGDVIAVLYRWMDDDVKATPLKTLQGQIWAAGFASGELTSHFFPDVAPAFSRWRSAGARIAVFSSGATSSQLPWFQHGPDGDLSTFINGYFDTVNAGPKRVASSYERIAAALGEPPGDVLFLSDVTAELDAASAAGWQTVGVRRPGEPYADADFGAHPVVESFDGLSVSFRGALDLGVVLDAGRTLAAEAARFAGLGWMRGTSGNLSKVLHRDPLYVAVTAGGLDKGDLRERDVAVVDAAGVPVPVRGLSAARPSAEAALHTKVAAVTGADAVVHVHSLGSVVAGRRWPAGVRVGGVEMLKGIGRMADDDIVIPVIPNSQDMTELGAWFEDAYVPDVPAIIIASHGLYAWGADPMRARHVTECVDWLLGYALAAASMTSSTLLTSPESNGGDHHDVPHRVHGRRDAGDAP